ncbi:MAG: phosphate/phosphite/phosphonate ABC transporter substrate-binding protein [Gammaproteobacteria bacterium]
MALTASFPMYDLPEVRDALDTIWEGIAQRLRQRGVADVPGALLHGRALPQLWSNPSLLISQCCGYDVVGRYAGRLRPIATPRYSAPGCEGSQYSSAVLVNATNKATELEHLRHSVCAINGPESHSGMNALRALLAPLSREGRFFAEVKISGGHPESIAMVTGGETDVCAIDCVTYALLQRYRPESVRGTRLLCYTESAPGLPYVTRTETDERLVTHVQSALVEAFEDETVQSACEQVFISGVELLPPAAYERITELEQTAIRHGYPDIL